MIAIFKAIVCFILLNLMFYSGVPAQIFEYFTHITITMPGPETYVPFSGMISLAYCILSLPRAERTFVRFFENCLKVVTFIAIVAYTTVNIPSLWNRTVDLTTETQTTQTAQVVVEADRSLYQNDIETIEAIIPTMPQFLLDRVKTIYIEDEATYLQKGQESNNENISDSAAYSFSKDMSIHIRIITNPWVSNDYRQTIAHELSHIYDFYDGNLLNPYGHSTSEEFASLYRANPTSISEYGSTDAYEFFAEAGGLYITNPTALYNQNLDVYKYFDQLYGSQM